MRGLGRDQVFEDLYVASTVGLDAMVGFDAEYLTPYLAAGVVDASTFFYVADDNIVTNNYHPYLGPAFSAGVDSLIADVVRIGAEFYMAPGGYSLPDKDIEVVKPAARYGKIYTGRLRIGVEI